MPMEGHGDIKVRQGYPGPLMKSPFSFKQYGQSGAWVSEIFPNIATIVDDLAFIHSCQGTSNDHVISHYEWNTGSIQMGYPERRFVGHLRPGQREPEPSGFRGGAGSKRWSVCAVRPTGRYGFLPAAYQGTVFRSKGDPILDLSAPSAIHECRTSSGRVWIRWTCSMQNFDEQYPGMSRTLGQNLFLRAGLSHARLRAGSS